MSISLPLAVVATALLSSALTLGALVLLAGWYRRRRLAALLDEASQVLASRVGDGVERAGVDLLPRLREEVRAGFEEAAEGLLPRFRSEVGAGLGEAAEELLPRLRAEVREGFKEAISEVLAGRVLGRAGEGLARKGSSVLEAGLDLIFGEEDDVRKR